MLSPPCKYSLAYVLFDVKNDGLAFVWTKLSVQAEFMSILVEKTG